MKLDKNQARVQKENLLENRVRNYLAGMEDFIEGKVDMNVGIEYCNGVACFLGLPKKVCKQIKEQLSGED